jgi:hypothetical protein
MGRYWVWLLILLTALGGFGFSHPPAGATHQTRSDLPLAQEPPGPDRFTVLTVEYTSYLWWMVSWESHDVVCAVDIDHDGLPTPGEVTLDCGTEISRKWWNQKPCTEFHGRECKGYYTYLVEAQPATREVPVYLAPASASLALEGCEPVESTSTSICETAPTLVISGREPIPDETIIEIAGTLDGGDFACPDSASCRLDLQETGADGAQLEFWAYSSYGDSSPILSAQIRVRLHDEGDPDQLYWYVDVLSKYWQGGPSATCAQSWESFPPVGGAPEWLSTPAFSEDLSSDIPYTYLAANLILQGLVDASACPEGGLGPGGEVNQCGLEAARDAILDWQNRFDALILDTAHATDVPARLLKSLFARESQFWPGIYQGAADVGLGQLTENGADTTLLWNPSFYAQACPFVLPGETCANGYLHLGTEEQALLRRAVVGSVDATCEQCPLGLDLSQADFSVSVFAHTMLANCEQAGQVIRNTTGETPGEAASFEDLWKFTLVNYNAGAGCLADAINGARVQRLDLTWENVAQFLPPACQAANDYVADISS